MGTGAIYPVPEDEITCAPIELPDHWPRAFGFDVWQAAKLLLDQNGDEAPVHAAMRADEMLDLGDLEGQAVWKAILKAVIELVSKEPDGTVH